MMFGEAMAVDALGIAVAALLAVKVAATAILLTRDRRDRWATRLWWATKLTPPIAAPCLVAIALLRQDRAGLAVYAMLTAFVLVAVPVAIVRRIGSRPPMI